MHANSSFALRRFTFWYLTNHMKERFIISPSLGKRKFEQSKKVYIQKRISHKNIHFVGVFAKSSKRTFFLIYKRIQCQVFAVICPRDDAKQLSRTFLRPNFSFFLDWAFSRMFTQNSQSVVLQTRADCLYFLSVNRKTMHFISLFAISVIRL